jgi:protein tyrosine phosphatase (PTP) superfamily phosphohydrolase (DUF442 family)
MVAVACLLGCHGPRHGVAPHRSGEPIGVQTDPLDSGPAVALGDTLPGLHNVFVLGPGVFSGSGPDTPEAFEALAGLGVKTVISVDGARPSLELAHERGMRYVHIPIGYDGMSSREQLDLTKAVRDAAGPVYLHCHHGQHRGPAAAAVAMIGLGRMTQPQAEAYLHAAGTSEAYPGLWFAARTMQHQTDAEIDAASQVLCLPGPLPEYQRVSGLVDGMVAIDTAWSNIKLVREADWGPPADHPDLAPAAETGILADHFRVLADDPDVRAEGGEFVEAMRHAAERASALEASFTRITPDAAFREQAFQAVWSSCTECHKRWRN